MTPPPAALLSGLVCLTCITTSCGHRVYSQDINTHTCSVLAVSAMSNCCTRNFLSKGRVCGWPVSARKTLKLSLYPLYIRYSLINSLMIKFSLQGSGRGCSCTVQVRHKAAKSLVTAHGICVAGVSMQHTMLAGRAPHIGGCCWLLLRACACCTSHRLMQRPCCLIAATY